MEGKVHYDVRNHISSVVRMYHTETVVHSRYTGVAATHDPPSHSQAGTGGARRIKVLRATRGGRVGQGSGRAARPLQAAPAIPSQPEARNLGEEVGGGLAMGRRPHLQDEVPHVSEPKARWRRGRQHQETCLEVLPAEDRARPHRTVPALGDGSRHCPVLVVAVPLANERPPLQGVPGMEAAGKDAVGGGAEGDGKVEESVEDPGPSGRWEMRAGSSRLPHLNGCGKAGAPAGEE